MSIIAFSGVIGPVPIGVIISEKHGSEVEITGNPIETGAEVNDHAYVRPKEIVLEVADSSAATTFAALVAFQESRVPFTLVTGLTVYEDMLIQSIDATRDAENSRILRATVTCRQVIIVSTGTAPASDAKSKSKSTKARAGGKKSNSAVSPSKSLSTDSATQDRAADVVSSGDQASSSVSTPKTTSLLKRMF